MALLADITWEEARALLPGAVAILPTGATEAHGPHLPLSTDVHIAQVMADEGARRLEARGIESVILPPIAYSSAGFAASFPGTVSIRPETATALVVDVGRALAEQGVRLLAIANAHLDPSHIASLDAAVAAIRGEGRLAVAFPDVTKKPWALRLTDEFRSGACHAGQYEGSIILAWRPDLVREGFRRSLPPNPSSLSRAIKEGKRSFEEAGGPRAYFGDPAAATFQEGKRSIVLLGAILEDAVLAALRATASNGHPSR